MFRTPIHKLSSAAVAAAAVAQSRPTRKPARKAVRHSVGLVRPVQSPVAVPEHLLPDSVCGCCGAVVSRVGCNVCE